MSYPTSVPYPLQLLIMTSILTLAACGGGGGGNATSYTVTATAGANGAISPTSTTVTEGNTTSFTVTPDTGYEIASVSGCSGSLSGTTYTTGGVTADCSVTADFQAVTLSVSDASVMEGDTGPGTLTFTITLTAPANGDVTADYTISDGTATNGNDYSPGTATGTLSISAGTTSTNLTVSVFGDTNVEPNEDFVLTLSNPSANVTLGTATAYGIIADDDSWRGPINDTGATSCYDGGATAGSCPNASYPGQDAEYGRDANAATNTATDGRVGFSFTKLDSIGVQLPDQTQPYSATPWSCVLDNNTKLMWEVKTTSGVHANNVSRFWYDSNPATNGGNAGQYSPTSNVDTQTFVTTVNNANFCGYNDWRLPTVEELLSIVDFNDTSSPIIDTNYFANATTTAANYWYVSATTPANNSSQYWMVSFISGQSALAGKTGACCLARLVRGGQ